jgi:ribonuclease BN (tRNA processing enzyme)
MIMRFAALLAVIFSASPAAAECRASLAVEVLGSGGPIADDERASSGYLVRIGGEARLLIDAGGGVFQRFGAAGAQVSDLDAVLVSHFHVDHTSDLPAILKSAFFEHRRESLALIGPAAAASLPGPAEWLSALYDPSSGAYRYQSGFLNGSGGLPRIDPVAVDSGAEKAVVVVENDDLKVTAIPVVHGPVPALGYLVESAGKRIVFGGDQGFESEFFETYLSGGPVDLLIAHHAIPQAEGGQPILLHRSPRQIGELAKIIGARRLILSHNMKRALEKLDAGLAAISENYKGPVEVAEDGDCITIVE